MVPCPQATFHPTWLIWWAAGRPPAAAPVPGTPTWPSGSAQTCSSSSCPTCPPSPPRGNASSRSTRSSGGEGPSHPCSPPNFLLLWLWHLQSFTHWNRWFDSTPRDSSQSSVMQCRLFCRLWYFAHIIHSSSHLFIWSSIPARALTQMCA